MFTLPFFKSPRSLCCLVSLAQCVIKPHLMCYVWWYYGPKLVEPWNPNASSTLLCVLCNKASNLLKVWHRWHGFCWYSELIWHTHTDKYTEDTHQNKFRLRHTHKYILKQSVMCTKQLPKLHRMKKFLIQKFTLV